MHLCYFMVCCSILWYTTVHYDIFQYILVDDSTLWYIPVCYGIFQYITVYSGILSYKPIYYGILHYIMACSTILWYMSYMITSLGNCLGAPISVVLTDLHSRPTPEEWCSPPTCIGYDLLVRGRE